MNYSLRLGKAFGIPISIHWTFLLLVGWILFSNLRQGYSLQESGMAVLFVLILFGCVILHELGHALAARRYGIQTKSIVMLPIGGVATLEKMPEKPFQELVVALAGPAVNVVIASALAGVLIGTGRQLLPTTAGYSELANFMPSLLVVNLFLAFFNLLPAFPMDGGRVLRAALSFKFSRVRATQIAVRIGQAMGVLFIIAGIFGNPFLVLIAVFIMFGAQTEYMMVKSKAQLESATAGHIIITRFTPLQATQTLGDAAHTLLNTQENSFLILQDNTIAGVLTKNTLIQGLAQFGKDAPISSAMTTPVHTVTPETPLSELMDYVLKTGHRFFPVVKDNTLVGIIDWENINEYKDIREALGKAS